MAEPTPPALPRSGGFAMLATNDDAVCVDGVCAVPEPEPAREEAEDGPGR